VNLLAIIGRVVLGTLQDVGQLAVFTWHGVSHCFRPPIFGRLVLAQMMRIGYFSLPVVALTTFFTGGVLALQIYYGGNEFNSESIVATIVALGITRELGPVMAGLMIAGRVSAAIAAELGTMRVTEQIDALTTLSTNPYKYLVAPRLIAAVLTLPLLVFVADVIGIFGGFVVGTQTLEFNPGVYVKNHRGLFGHG
jgi:phospholipid/cholesterol/gamma-HCH transport system permease protein